jgi:Holliday junction resolvase-like predicted endonuclease
MSTQMTDSQQTYSLLEKLKLYPEVVLDEVVNSQRDKLRNLFEQINNPKDDDDIGLMLEDLARNLLESQYLIFNRGRRRCKTGEIDLDFTVKKIEATLFHEFDYLLIVECKNWSKRAGSPELKVFRQKMMEVGAKVSIFFSKQGLTKPANDEVRDAWVVNKMIILVFDNKDLDRIINKSENLYKILNNKYLAVRTSSKE